MTIRRVLPVGDQYAKAVCYRDIVYLAGLIASDWSQDAAGQTREIFAEIDALLSEAGTSKDRILTLTVYIASFDDYATFKQVYAEWMPKSALPARATIGAQLLDPRLRIEIMATAALT